MDLEKIEAHINAMDQKYDANFGEWIQNEDNCKIVGSNLKRYVEEYSISRFIAVTKWIIKDWTLKSIIQFTKKLITEDLGMKTGEEYWRRINILAGFIFTWDSVFITEFLLSLTSDFTTERKAQLLADILTLFEAQKFTEILSCLESKMDTKAKEMLIKKYRNAVYKKSKNTWAKSESMVNAFNLS
ncbi:hypothetical protein ENBRE01_0518 [Enteropsectra breve]|nr:hypothetical protein ENBRE01_0518 [Enteropsectra breve]